MYYAKCKIDQNYYYIVTDENNLLFVGSPDGEEEEIYRFLDNVELVEDYTKVEKYHEALKRYFLKEKNELDFTIPAGTKFQENVWAEVAKIPYGETRTYSEIAIALGNEKAVRAVATAIGKNPLLIFLPCHRVIGKNGKLSGYRGGLELKAKLLKLENAL